MSRTVSERCRMCRVTTRVVAVCALLLPRLVRAASVDHSAFDRILQENVRDGRVDYVRIRGSYMPDLKSYLDLLEFVDVKKLPRNEQLAFCLNLYNATLIYAIADRYRPELTCETHDFAIFKEPLVRTKSGVISLNDLRDKAIRGVFKDARVHVGMVTGARSSPAILSRAFHGEDVERLLDESMSWFVTDVFRNPIDDVTKDLKLSRVFEWYADDFGGKDALASYVGKYAGKDFKGYKVSFVEYHWLLNQTVD